MLIKLKPSQNIHPRLQTYLNRNAITHSALQMKGHDVTLWTRDEIYNHVDKTISGPKNVFVYGGVVLYNNPPHFKFLE